MAADDNEALACEQLTCFGLIERCTLCAHHDRMHVLTAGQCLVAEVKRLGQHDHAAAAAIRRIICLVVLVQRIVANVGRTNFDQTLGLCTADDALLHNPFDQRGE